MIGGRENGADVIGLALGQRAVALGFEELGIAEDRRQRRAQLIADVAHKLRFQPVSGLEGFGAVTQGRLDAAGGGHVREGDQRVAVRQRVGDVGEQRAVRAAHLAGGGLTRAGRRIGDVHLDGVPDVRIVEQGHAAFDHVVIVRRVLEQIRRQVPDALERAVVQLEPAVAAEHGDRLVQVVEGGALRLDQRIEARLQVELDGDVLEQQQQAAHRVTLAGDRQRAPVREGPLVLFHAVEVEIVGNLLGAPFGIVRAAGNLAALAQPVEQLAMVRPVEKEGFFKVPHVAEGLVVEGQLALGAEDGDGVGHMVQRFVMGTDVAVQFFARVLLHRHVKGHRPCPAGQRECQHTHRPAIALDHDMTRLVMLLAVGNRLAGLLGHRLVERRLLLQQPVEARDVDGGEIGGVGPLQAAHAGHTPGRERRLAQHVEEGGRIAGDHLARFLEFSAGGAFFKPLDGRISDPHHGARAGRAAIGFQEASRRADDGQRERISLLAQLAQPNAQRRVLSRRVACFQIGDAFDDPDGRIVRDGGVRETQKARQRHGRAEHVRRRNFVAFDFQRLALPDQDHARMGT